MALIRTVNIAGNDFSYWRINSINIDKAEKRAFVRLHLYKDEAYAKSVGSTSIKTEIFVWRGADFPYSVEDLDEANPFIIAYNKIKAPVLNEQGVNTNIWSNAQDA